MEEPYYFKIVLYFIVFYGLVPVIIYLQNSSFASIGLYLCFSLFLATFWNILYPERLHGLVGQNIDTKNHSVKRTMYALSNSLLILLTLLGILLESKLAFITSLNQITFPKIIVFLYLYLLYYRFSREGLHKLYEYSEDYRKKYISYVPETNLYFIPIVVLYACILVYAHTIIMKLI